MMKENNLSEPKKKILCMAVVQAQDADFAEDAIRAMKFFVTACPVRGRF
jgi:hypothetical protein